VLAPRPVGGEPDAEAEDRDRAFAAAGWEVRPAQAWMAKELVDRLQEHGQFDGTSRGDTH
jgi:hypothetical protein